MQGAAQSGGDPAIQIHNNTSSGVTFIKINKINQAGTKVSATTANNNLRGYQFFFDKAITIINYWNGYTGSYAATNKDNFSHDITLGPGAATAPGYVSGENRQVLGVSTAPTARVGLYDTTFVAPVGFSGLSETFGTWQQFFKITPNNAIMLDDSGLLFSGVTGNVDDQLVNADVTITSSTSDP